MKRTYSNNLKLFVAVSTHLSITTLNGHGLDAPVKQRVDIYLMDYSAAIKKKKSKILPSATARMTCRVFC